MHTNLIYTLFSEICKFSATRTEVFLVSFVRSLLQCNKFYHRHVFVEQGLGQQRNGWLTKQTLVGEDGSDLRDSALLLERGQLIEAGGNENLKNELQ